MRSQRWWILSVLLALLGAAPVVTAETPPVNFKAKQPLMITASGQCMDYMTVKVLADRLKLNFKYDPLVPAEKLKGFQTLVIAAGASAKGFGAAGINADVELARTKKLIAEAKKDKITLVGVHIGGEERRGPTSVPFVELLAKNADLLIVWEQSDEDGYFTKVAQKRKVPLIVLKQVLELQDVLKQIFAP